VFAQEKTSVPLVYNALKVRHITNWNQCSCV